MSQELLEGNRLIAEFMGFYRYSDSPYYYSKDENGEIEHRGMYFDALKYHTSWDWLMPVVEKIEKMDFTVHIGNFSYCTISKFENDEDPWQGVHISTEVDPIYGRVKSKIHGVWLAVVQFVNFYNQPQKR